MPRFWINNRLHQGEVVQTLRNQVRGELSILALSFTPFFLTGPATLRAATVKSILERRWDTLGFKPADEETERWLRAKARMAAGEKYEIKSIHEV